MFQERIMDRLPSREEFDEHKLVVSERSTKAKISGGIATVLGVGSIVFPPLTLAAQAMVLEMTRQITLRGIEVNKFLLEYPVFDK